MDESMRIDLAIEEIGGAMRSLGYKESTMQMLIGQAKILAGFCKDGLYTSAAGEEFCSCGHPDGTPFRPSHVKKRERVVRMVEEFFASGCVDLGPQRADSIDMPAREPMPSLLTAFWEHCLSRELKASTCKNYHSMAREFAIWLEDGGIADLASVAPSHVLGFLSHMAERRPNTDAFYIKASLRPFLRFLGRDDLAECLRIASSVRSHKIIEVLSDDVEEAVAAACCGHDAVSARDAAMTLIALTTGLRAGDILDIRLGDVDWGRSTLTLRQNKTGNLVILPLQPSALSALGKYILNDRPNPFIEGDDHVFLRKRAPHTPMPSAATVYQATERVLSIAGASGGGTRLFRRNAATKLLRSGAPSPVISAILGHARQATTDIYMEVDAPRMRECVLSLPKAVAPWL